MEHKIVNMEKKLSNIAETDGFLTVKQVSQILQISLNKAYDLFNIPSFPGKKIKGVGLRVRASQLYEYFDKYKSD
jgi:predicted DNA-binding transcriptional regulator AlpA